LQQTNLRLCSSLRIPLTHTSAIVNFVGITPHHPIGVTGNGVSMHKSTRIILAGFATLGFALTAPITASASTTGTQGHPTGCNYSIADKWRTQAACKHSNGGRYRAIANCKDPETGKVLPREGNWMSNGAPSYAYCHGNERPSVAGVETSPHK
jgi:hypothetical protein